MLSGLISREISHIDSILDSVPFDAGCEPKSYFLDMCKLTHTDISRLNITDASWEATQLPVGKLLKLAISFGNLMKTFQLERAAHEAKTHQPKTQNSDPFGDNYGADRSSPVAPYYVNFARNLKLILKNFDVGNNAPPAHAFARSPAKMDEIPPNASPASGSLHTSPIRVASRQALIEKLDINIRLDALFTLKIVLKLLRKIYTILGASAREVPESASPGQPLEHVAETASIFSSVSSNSSGSEPVATMDDYARLVADTVVKVNYGITEPFTRFLKSEVADRKVMRGFQNLISSI